MFPRIPPLPEIRRSTAVWRSVFFHRNRNEGASPILWIFECPALVCADRGDQSGEELRTTSAAGLVSRVHTGEESRSGYASAHGSGPTPRRDCRRHPHRYVRQYAGPRPGHRWDPAAQDRYRTARRDEAGESVRHICQGASRPGYQPWDLRVQPALQRLIHQDRRQIGSTRSGGRRARNIENGCGGRYSDRGCDDCCETRHRCDGPVEAAHSGITDGENNKGYSPQNVTQIISSQAPEERASIYFVAFDVAATMFDSVRDSGGLVLAASNETDLQGTLDYLLSGKILAEQPLA